jgi:SAM-dependent methyltransferase
MIAIADLNQEIHANDPMRAAAETYFNVSISALAAIELALSAAGKTKVGNILDFGCGYGRVLRAIRARWPDAAIMAADLMANGIRFCSEAFGAEPFQAKRDTSDAPLPRKFDLIWVGSVFTHLAATEWHSMLGYLSGSLAPDGLLVFTTHGRTSQWVFKNHTLKKSGLSEEKFEQIIRDFNSEGFGFARFTDGQLKHIIEKNEAAVAKDGYGLSFSRTDWVCRQINEFPYLRLQSYTEGGWGNNQDVVAVGRPRILRALEAAPETSLG